MTDALKTALTEAALAAEQALSDALAGDDPDYGIILEAERYSVLGAGKRIRPFLVLAFARLFGGDDRAALPFAAAIELMHCFSLIHDDLPCMDNDDLRRGKPTNHIVYGEATALLAGDALAIRALEVAASNEAVSPAEAIRAVRTLADAAGPFGMIGGQIMDMYGESHPLTLEQLRKLQMHKTGALIRAAALLGCIAAEIPAGDERITAALTYADGIGLAFQIIDDILDVLGDEATLGKPIGSDAASGKSTFVTHLGVEEARRVAEKMTAMAKHAIEPYPDSALLCDLADWLLCRAH